MTRETKIGLLVGLAFIIVIGILLSDHLTQSNEPQPAVLAVAGNSVRSAITVPGVTGSGAAGPTITQAPPPANVQPTSAVPTRDEVQHPEPPVQIVQVGAPTLTTSSPTPGNQARPAQQPAAPSQNGNVAISSQPPADATSTTTAQDAPSTPVVSTQENNQNNSPADSGPVVTQAPNSVAGAINNALRNAARQVGEELVSTGGNGTSNGQRQSGNATPPAQQITGTKYVAVNGDTLNKLAGRFMGGNTQANRDAIMAANPFMKGDPNKIIVGRTYIIPTSASAPPTAGSTASAVAPVPTAPTAPAPVAQKSETTTTSSSTESLYTVKEGDSLWKIATEQCGGPGAIAAIKELNKDTLKGGETVLVDMKLRLPSKPVASAN